MSFFENTRKPVGLGGKIMVAMMNFGHSAMAAWGLHFLQPAPDAMVLDCGCGGGANIKTLLKLCPNGKVQGIDYSAVSVEKARKVNARAIAAGRCTVQQASVAELPFEAEKFDVVTAFETVYFWPELAQNFREVYRVLKPGGIFFICNEANGETTKDDKWTQIIDGMTIYMVEKDFHFARHGNTVCTGLLQLGQQIRHAGRAEQHVFVDTFKVVFAADELCAELFQRFAVFAQRRFAALIAHRNGCTVGFKLLNERQIGASNADKRDALAGKRRVKFVCCHNSELSPLF